MYLEAVADSAVVVLRAIADAKLWIILLRSMCVRYIFPLCR